MMKKVESGDYVKLCYTGKLENGVVFDRTDECGPLEIQVGTGSMVEGFENAIVGMGQNEKKSFVLEPEEAYGERDERLQRTFRRSTLPLTFNPFPGQVILFTTRSGLEVPATVKFVDQEILVADFNHPLAGKALTFEVEVVEINDSRSPSPSECGPRCCCSR